MSQNEDDQSAHSEDPSTRGAIHNALPEVRLDINDELDAVDEKLHNFVLPENVKEQIYERSKCKNENDHDCVICLEVYKEKETIRVVEPCNHLYHTYCIKKWLFNNNRSCPMCRNHIPY
uniref:RING-type domain-containing protein n=1 Tax=Tanacetum cinerariifolium TaxID=118510 RepID=A0A699RF46_TANCI|nr:hypothetical protein [Tanacetum cinerariifolium]